MGKSPHHVKNTQDFIDNIKGIHLGEDQCMMSYDVKALFTSVPTTKAIIIIKQLLEEDQELQQKNLIIHRKHHKSSGVLHYQHLLQLPREVL